MSGKQKAETYAVTFGSNTHMNSNGILKVKGKRTPKIRKRF
jgi:hypothetical protein